MTCYILCNQVPRLLSDLIFFPLLILPLFQPHWLPAKHMLLSVLLYLLSPLPGQLFICPTVILSWKFFLQNHLIIKDTHTHTLLMLYLALFLFRAHNATWNQCFCWLSIVYITRIKLQKDLWISSITTMPTYRTSSKRKTTIQ
jgi:hypothetical protein